MGALRALTRPATILRLPGLRPSGVRSRLGRITCLLACLFGGLLPVDLRAEEPVEAFLEQLVSRGYDDLAAEYLERLEGSPRVSPNFRDGLKLLQGEVLLAQAKRSATVDAARDSLKQAQASFEAFVKDQPEKAESILAKLRLATVESELGRLHLAEAKAKAATESERSASHNAARERFTSAAKQLRASMSELEAAVDKLPGAAVGVDDETAGRRERLKQEVVQAKVTLAVVLFEQAETYEDQETQASRLKQAEELFRELATNYRRKLAGLTAQLYQGRCRKRLGDLRGAVAFFEDLVVLPSDEEVLRPLKTRALHAAMECWLEPELQELETARQRAEVWLNQQRSHERSDRDWLGVQLMLARTYKQLVDQGDQKKPGLMLGEARKLAEHVARFASEHQQPAQTLLVDLGVDPAEGPTIPEVSTFEEAYLAAQNALSRRQLASQALLRLQQTGSSTSEVTEQLRIAKSQVAAEERAAITLFRRALVLADDKTNEEQIVQVRHYLCTLYYYAGDYPAAAVMGEFLAMRYPATTAGKESASVVLAAYVQLYGDGKQPWSDSVEARMVRAAEAMARNWEGEPAADAAWATLVNLAVRRNDATEAVRILDRMTEGSAQKVQAAVSAGQALWNLSVQQSQAGENDATVSETRQRAVELLNQSLAVDAASPPSIVTLNARLILAQHLTATNDAVQAVKLLDEPKQGPRALIEEGHPLVSAPDMMRRILTTSILTYIAALPNAENAESLVDKTLDSLDRLQKLPDHDAVGLSSTYLALARNLERQVAESQGTRQAVIIRAYRQFLDRAASTTDEFEIRMWLADAYLNLGQIVAKGAGGKEKSAPLFEQATQAYRQLMDQAAQGNATLSPQQQLLIQTRLAAAFAAQGDYRTSIAQFVKILRQQPNQVYVQLEAARTLMRWGDAGSVDAYRQAIEGAEPDARTRKNIVWGFGRLAKLVASNAALANTFFEARRTMAEARYKIALKQSKSEREKSLARAERVLLMTARLYPELGGDENKTQYDELMRKIQKALGKTVTGI